MSPFADSLPDVDRLLLALVRRPETGSAFPDSAWEPLLDRAFPQGLALELERMSGAGRVALPDRAAARLALRSAEERLWLRRLRAELAGLLAILDEARIPVLVLKGIPLGERLTGDPLGRPSTDLDLLVVPDALPVATRLLAASGWKGSDPAGRPHLGAHHLSFVRQALLLELHWRPLPESPVEATAGLLERSIVAEIDGLPPLRRLAPADELPFLAAHAVAHGFGRLLWVLDLARYAERFPSLSDEEVVEGARRLRGGRALEIAGRAVGELLGVQLPGGRPTGRGARFELLSGRLGRILDEGLPIERRGLDTLAWRIFAADGAREAAAVAGGIPLRALVARGRESGGGEG
jgi:hypothetical protein